MPRARGGVLVQPVEMTVLLEVEADLRDGDRRVELEDVVGNRIDVEELDGLERAPDFLPPAAMPRRIEYVTSVRRYAGTPVRRYAGTPVRSSAGFD